MDFGKAIEAVKDGKRISREGWNGKSQYVELATCISYKNTVGEIVNVNHDTIGNAALAFVGTSGVQLGWLASQADMLADDWIIIESNAGFSADRECPKRRAPHISIKSEGTRSRVFVDGKELPGVRGYRFSHYLQENNSLPLLVIDLKATDVTLDTAMCPELPYPWNGFYCHKENNH